KQAKEPRFLEPKEVILTFDDGPLPAITRSVLDTLDQFCTKATFFEIGEMAIAYPSTVKSVLARGHTVGTHTWSHPLNLRHL
ncbi:polysaccharide deacetylase family protein, partial [Providencia rettgeri]|uniref:polysaccharide deacetylase family protein n=1 Tax=Providencia rettgeri TaxID=587 RepID=UPI002360F6CC